MNMESNEKPIINRIKVVLVEQRRTNKWLADTLGKDCTTVSKWCAVFSKRVCQPFVCPSLFYQDNFDAVDNGFLV